MPTLASILETAERDAYREALARHGGSITEAARELGVSRVTASRAIKKLGPVIDTDRHNITREFATLSAWLDETYPHRDPATVGRRGDSRRGSVVRFTPPEADDRARHRARAPSRTCTPPDVA